MNVKHEHPSWGARKIRERLLRRFSSISIPAKSTIHALLDRYGLVERRGRARRHAQGTPLALQRKLLIEGKHPTERATRIRMQKLEAKRRAKVDAEHGTKLGLPTSNRSFWLPLD